MNLDAFPAPTLSFGPDEEALRGRLRAWLAGNDPGVQPEEYQERVAAQIRWQETLHAAGFVGLSWPEAYGGAGLSSAAEAVLAEELAGTGMPELINRIGVYMIGPTLMDMAVEEQRRRYLPGMLDASELWCQGFSEPDAGSDLAAVRTRARPRRRRLRAQRAEGLDVAGRHRALVRGARAHRPGVAGATGASAC